MSDRITIDGLTFLVTQIRFKAGDVVRVSRDNDNETYNLFRDKELTITHVATKYMPAKQFFDQGKPNGYHPGFDDCGAALYDLEATDGTPVNCSLYDWELERA
jgi:hypothetical protein